jgi:transporter family protein
VLYSAAEGSQPTLVLQVERWAVLPDRARIAAELPGQRGKEMRADVVGLAAVTIVAWGTWGVFSKLAIERIDQQVMVWGSLIVVPAIILIFLSASGQLVPLEMHPSGIAFAALGGVGAALGTVCFYLLLARERASLAVPLTSLYPALTVILSVLFLKEHLNGAQVLGVFFSLAAVALLSR